MEEDKLDGVALLETDPPHAKVITGQLTHCQPQRYTAVPSVPSSLYPFWIKEVLKTLRTAQALSDVIVVLEIQT